MGVGTMRKAAWAFALLALLAVPARAQEDAAREARWSDLRQAVFGQREVLDGAGLIALDAPARAHDAALVPVTITLTGRERVKAIYLMVDGNPSPLAGTFRFGPLADTRTLKTRVRVEQYSPIHAVAETEDGRLFSTERFVKAAGGCSAPAAKDAAAALARLGQMRMRLEGGDAGAPAMAHLLISHPNNTGMAMDQVSRLFVPARYVQDVRVTQGGVSVLEFEGDISLSEDPAISFGFVPQGAEPPHVVVKDSARAVFQQSFPLVRQGS